MIESGDLSRPAQVRVCDTYARTWKTLWLRQRPVWRVVFHGYIDSVEQSINEGTSIEMRGALDRLARMKVV